MRVGPFTVSLARSTRPDLDEQGASGTEVSASSSRPGAGYVTQEDYVPELRGENLYREYDKMRKSDSQVKGILSAIKLPIMAADFKLEEPPEATETERANTEFLSTYLFKRWRYTLRQMLLHLDYGSMPMEKVWSIDKDNGTPLAVCRLAPRLPKTVIEWNVTEHGDFSGIVQQAPTVSGFKRVNIDADKLLLFVNELEGADYRGLSILRAARKDWYYKDKLQRINAITLEKRGAGIDVGTLTGGNEEKQARAEDVLMSVRTHERSYILETEDFKYRQEGLGSGGTISALESIKYHDWSMLFGTLTQFLGMGDGQGGSFAMHADKTSFFLMAELGISNEILEPFNDDLLPQWTLYNYGPDVRPPTLTHSRLDRRDAKAVADALKALVPEGIITLDPGLEREMRALLELPEAEVLEPELAWKGVQARQIAAMTAELEKRGFDPAGIKVPFLSEQAAAMGSYAKARKHAEALTDALRNLASVRDASAIRFGMVAVGSKAHG